MARAMEKRSGRAERAAAVLSEKEANKPLPDQFWDELLAPFGKINGRKKLKSKANAALSEPDWRAQMTAAKSPEELGEGFASYFWPRMPLQYRAFVLRRIAELKAGEEKLKAAAAKWEYLEPYAEHAASHGMTVWEYIAFMSSNEDLAREGDLVGALINVLTFCGIDPQQAAKELLRHCAEQELPNLNASIAYIFAQVDAGKASKEQAISALMALHDRAIPLGLKLDSKAGGFQFAEAA